jgi:hypothetical protein
MSVSESELVEEYWQRVGGQLIEEFEAVQRGENNGHRYLDAVIIKNKEKERLDSYSSVQLDGEDVIVVQCKTKRLGMYLMGQAYFSMHLIERHNPASIQSVALCTRTDSVLGPIFESYPNCEVVEIDPR